MAEANNMIRAARIGDMDVMARPAKGEFMRMARLVEAGASLIMYPRCESADEARELVRCGKFPPLGERGFFSASADNPYSTMPAKDYVREANEQTILIAQIESPNAVRHAAGIAAVDGIDMLFFGPGDFSVVAGVSPWPRANGSARSCLTWNTRSECSGSARRCCAMEATCTSSARR